MPQASPHLCPWPWPFDHDPLPSLSALHPLQDHVSRGDDSNAHHTSTFTEQLHRWMTTIIIVRHLCVRTFIIRRITLSCWDTIAVRLIPTDSNRHFFAFTAATSAKHTQWYNDHTQKYSLSRQNYTSLVLRVSQQPCVTWMVVLSHCMCQKLWFYF